MKIQISKGKVKELVVEELLNLNATRTNIEDLQNREILK